MPYALCPIPARAPHVTEKGYIIPATIPKWSKFTIFIASEGFFMVFRVGLLEKFIIS
jgi:hypothetical protein